MKFFKIPIFLTALIAAACNYVGKSKPQKLVKHTVYVIGDTFTVHSPKPVIKDTSYLEALFKTHKLVDINELDSGIKVNLRYADTNNFLHRNFYDGLSRAYFIREVADKIISAQKYLKEVNPNYSLMIWDAARPLHIQQMMWDSLDMPPDKKFNYLAPPYEISLHNYGCAVDLTIINDSTGQLLEMGTGFDYFGKLAEPIYEYHFLKTGELSETAIENRKILRNVMQRAKLNPINSEWWHFNYCTKDYAAANFKVIK